MYTLLVAAFVLLIAYAIGRALHYFDVPFFKERENDENSYH